MDSQHQNAETGLSPNEAQPIKYFDITAGGDLESAVVNAEKHLIFQGRIRKAAIKLTSYVDWSDFGGNPYLEWKGASKIAMAFGVSYTLDAILPEICKDEIGEWIEYTISGKATWNGRTVTEIGTGSSRDDFFGKRTREKENGEKEKYYLPLSEIDRTDIKKKALTNFLNRGLKSLMGLSFSWEEISDLTDGRINKEKCGASGRSINYDRGKKGGSQQGDAETTKKRGELRSMLLEMSNGNKKEARKSLKELSTWKKGDKTYEGKETVDDLSIKQVHFLHRKISDEYSRFVDFMNSKDGAQ